MPVIRQASGTRTVIGSGPAAPLFIDQIPGRDLQPAVRLCEHLARYLEEQLVALPPKPTGFLVERRLMGNERELMVEEHAKRFGDTVEPAMAALMPAREAVEPVSEAILQHMKNGIASRGERVGQY